MTTYRGKHFRTASDDSRSFKQAPQNFKGEPSAPGGAEHPRRESASALRARTGVNRAKNSPQEGRGSRLHTRITADTPGVFQSHAAVQEIEGRSRPAGKKHLLVGVLLIAALAVVLIGCVFFLGPVFSGFFAGGEDENIEPGVAVVITIPAGAATEEIANILNRANVIKDTRAFIAEVKRMGAEQSLKPGTYELETLMDSTSLINRLVSGPLEQGNKLTIPEGLTVEQTAAVVETATGIPAADFLACVYAAGEYVAEFPFLEGAYNNSMEGFLYPKTYDVPVSATADTVVRILLKQYAVETGSLDISAAQARGLTLHDVVTIASLIEKETAAETERALVSSVIYNRLRDGMKLQIDATVVYALGPTYDGHPLTWGDLEVDSPYNTYRVDELPAGPICSPSIASLQAAAQPADTDYYYYVLTSKEGTHTFCRTSEEFEAAKEEYMRIFGIE